MSEHRIIVVKTDKEHAAGVYCPICEFGTNEVTFWSFEATMGLHLQGTGHQMIYVGFPEDDQ